MERGGTLYATWIRVPAGSRSLSKARSSESQIFLSRGTAATLAYTAPMAKRKTAGSGTRRRSMSGEPPSSPSELILYTTPDQQTRIEVRLEDETVWLSQRQLADLFQKSVKTINEHIGNVFDEGELDREATIRKSRIVQSEGAREGAREVELYNLDVIISVGYRVSDARRRHELVTMRAVGGICLRVKTPPAAIRSPA